MKTLDQADARFLRRILFALIVSTMATGAFAAFATVNAEQSGQVNFRLPILMAE